MLNVYHNYIIADLLLKLGLFEESLEYAERALAINPDYFQAICTKGILFLYYQSIADSLRMLARFKESIE